MGVGNPGSRYEATRHNAGKRAVAILADDLRVSFKKAKAPARVAESRIDDHPAILVLPETYMNESGRAVQPLLKWYRSEPEKLVVVHDDIDLATAALRIKKGGSTAGHHGLDSIVASIGTNSFYRVRIGVGRPSDPRHEPADYVLERMGAEARAELGEAERLAAEAVIATVRDGLELAQGKYNRSGAESQRSPEDSTEDRTEGP